MSRSSSVISPRPVAFANAAGVVSFLAFLMPAAAQDIRGLEVCTAEKQLERRTSCLQSNTELLQQALTRLTRDSQGKLDAANREIAALKAAMTKLEADMAELKKPQSVKSQTKSDKK